MVLVVGGGWQLVLERARSMDMSCAGGWGIGGGVRVGLNSRGGGGTSQHLYHQPSSESVSGVMMGTCFLA